jgi:hypothetical protein
VDEGVGGLLLEFPYHLHGEIGVAKLSVELLSGEFFPVLDLAELVLQLIEDVREGVEGSLIFQLVGRVRGFVLPGEDWNDVAFLLIVDPDARGGDAKQLAIDLDVVVLRIDADRMIAIVGIIGIGLVLTYAVLVKVQEVPSVASQVMVHEMTDGVSLDPLMHQPHPLDRFDDRPVLGWVEVEAGG